MKRLIALGAAVLAFSAVQLRADTAPTAVVFAEDGAVSQPLTDVPGDAARGLKIATTRSMGNCVACHAAKGWADAPLPGNIGPVLDGACERYSQAQLRGIVVNAKHTFDGTIMPSFYNVSNIVRPGDGYTGKAAKSITPILTAQQVEDLVALLMTFKN